MMWQGTGSIVGISDLELGACNWLILLFYTSMQYSLLQWSWFFLRSVGQSSLQRDKSFLCCLSTVARSLFAKSSNGEGLGPRWRYPPPGSGNRPGNSTCKQFGLSAFEQGLCLYIYIRLCLTMFLYFRVLSVQISWWERGSSDPVDFHMYMFFAPSSRDHLLCFLLNHPKANCSFDNVDTLWSTEEPQILSNTLLTSRNAVDVVPAEGVQLLLRRSVLCVRRTSGGA